MSSALKRLIENERLFLAEKENRIDPASASAKLSSSESDEKEWNSQIQKLEGEIAGYKVAMGRSQIQAFRDAREIKNLKKENKDLIALKDQLSDIETRAVGRIRSLEAECKESHIKVTIPSDYAPHIRKNLQKIAQSSVDQQMTLYLNKENVVPR